MKACLCAALVMWAASARADVLFDFVADPDRRAAAPGRDEEARLLARFPHPHAAGKTCDPNLPGTPPNERAGGQLMPRVTTIRAAVTRATAAQDVYLIDYCATGVRVPRTRRLLVLDGGKVRFDRELDAGVPADEVLGAADVDGDGRAELLLSRTEYRGGRSVVSVQLVRLAKPRLAVLGVWTGIEHCTPGKFDDAITHRVTYTRGRRPAFREATAKQHCYYPPGDDRGVGSPP